jgi:hypothetical protein
MNPDRPFILNFEIADGTRHAYFDAGCMPKKR